MSCRNCGINTVVPNNTAPSTKLNNTVAAKLRFFSNFNSSTGCGVRHSWNTSVTSATAAMMPNVVMKPDPNQSSCWPLSRITCRHPMPRTISDRPMESILMPAPLNFLSHGGSSTTVEVKNNESNPTGTLIRKIQRQLQLSVIQPPSV